MVVVLETGATEKQIEEVVRVLRDHGFDIHRSAGVQHTVLGAIGVHPEFDHRQIEVLPGVAEVVRITEPFKLASRAFKREGSIFDIGGIKIGGQEIVVMAGPCSVENEEQIFKIAKYVKDAGAKILRGGAFKPRTSPYSFQGLGEEGLKLLRAAADKYKLKVITEVMDKSDIDLIEKYADILQVGARNMQNYTFLKELGRASKPVMLKRGIAATIDEWLMSAEYILSGGNQQVILCERGIRTFETATRNTMDISAIPVVKKKSHLPIIADPSHGIGIRDKVIPMARAAVAAGADGIMVEVHHDPDHALSDGAQSLYPDQFSQLMKEVRIIAQAIERTIA
jgi:3-deoxy-7-phosphoheptulonate synthase